MKPIEYQVDLEYLQALRCVEYRIPRCDSLQKPGYIATLGLRYGLIGAAATYHLLSSCSNDERPSVLAATRSWPRLVEDHICYELIDDVPISNDPTFPITVARFAERPILLALPLMDRFLTLNLCLEAVCHIYESEVEDQIYSQWPWYRRRSALVEYRKKTSQSLSYALHFYERRLYDLHEVPEIALLGE